MERRSSAKIGLNWSGAPAVCEKNKNETVRVIRLPAVTDLCNEKKGVVIMFRKLWLFLVLIIVTPFWFCTEKPKDAGDVGEVTLADGFINPPLSARPGAYWVWNNGNVNLSRLTYELEEMKDKGLSGYDIFDVGERFPEEGVIPPGPPFMGKESVESICYAIKEATRLGLELGLITSSSWNAGGSWVKPEHANMALFNSFITM